MIVFRSAMVVLLLLPALAFGQAKETDEDKVSNDQPGRPLQMPPASTEVKEALDDFERFQRRGAWERALKALYTIADDQTLRFVDGQDGFIVPVARKRRTVLAALSPEGRAAYRLFYDAEAKKLLEEADGPSELKNLERVYSAYFVSSVGDNAADRLGDLYFETGRFDRAADCWLAILHDHPDTDLSPALISVKAALALTRAGRKTECDQVRAELADRYSDEKITIAGQTAPPVELLRRLLGDEAHATVAADTGARAADPGPTAEPAKALWQMRFAATIEAGMTPPELTQWEANPLSNVVPAVTTSGSTLFANYLGYIFAQDLDTGKLLWRTAPFHQIKLLAMQNQGRAVEPDRFAIIASGEHVWTVARDLKDQNFFAPFTLTCYRTERGSVAWHSKDLSDYAQIDMVGPPILAAGTLLIAGKSLANPQQQQQPPQQFVLAIRPEDGKLLWKTEIGVFRQAQQYFFYYGNPDPSPRPQLLYRGGAIYVETHVGVLARLDADSGALDWGYGYRTDTSQGQGRFFFWPPPPREPTTASTPPVSFGDALLVKGVQSDRLAAVEPNQMKRLWERPIAKSARLLAALDQSVFIGGPEIGALDLQSRQLRWATRVPEGSAEGQVLMRPDAIWQLTPRGIFEIELKSGKVRRIFRGEDLGASGGDLVLAGRLLLAVSNRTISAYPLRAAGTEVSVGEIPAATTKRASND